MALAGGPATRLFCRLSFYTFRSRLGLIQTVYHRLCCTYRTYHSRSLSFLATPVPGLPVDTHMALGPRAAVSSR